MWFSLPTLFVFMFIYKAPKLIGPFVFLFLNGSLEVMWHMVFSSEKTINDVTWEFSLIRNAIV